MCLGEYICLAKVLQKGYVFKLSESLTTIQILVLYSPIHDSFVWPRKQKQTGDK